MEDPELTALREELRAKDSLIDELRAKLEKEAPKGSGGWRAPLAGPGVLRGAELLWSQTTGTPKMASGRAQTPLPPSRPGACFHPEASVGARALRLAGRRRSRREASETFRARNRGVALPFAQRLMSSETRSTAALFGLCHCVAWRGR